eukprot:COSAG03_NODE_295_length_9272_cov_67.000545_6_plen_40_part_01
MWGGGGGGGGLKWALWVHPRQAPKPPSPPPPQPPGGKPHR